MGRRDGWRRESGGERTRRGRENGGESRGIRIAMIATIYKIVADGQFMLLASCVQRSLLTGHLVVLLSTLLPTVAVPRPQTIQMATNGHSTSMVDACASGAVV